MVHSLFEVIFHYAVFLYVFNISVVFDVFNEVWQSAFVISYDLPTRVRLSVADLRLEATAFWLLVSAAIGHCLSCRHRALQLGFCALTPPVICILQSGFRDSSIRFRRRSDTIRFHVMVSIGSFAVHEVIMTWVVCVLY